MPIIHSISFSDSTNTAKVDPKMNKSNIKNNSDKASLGSVNVKANNNVNDDGDDSDSGKSSTL